MPGISGFSVLDLLTEGLQCFQVGLLANLGKSSEK